MMGETRATMRRGMSVGRIITSMLISFSQLTFSAFWLKADGPLIWVVVYNAALEALFVLLYLHRLHAPSDSMRWTRVVRAAKLGTGFLLILGAAVIIIGLNITPASAYLAWFQLVREGVGGGTLAYMFTVKFAYFGALFAGLFLLRSAIFALLNLAAIDLLIAGVLLGRPELAAIGVVLFLLSVGQQAVRRMGRIQSRAAVAVLQVAFVSALIALPLSVAHLRNGLIDGLFSVRMEGMVAEIFPSFPFLYNVPGYGYSLSTSQIGDQPALTSRPVFEVTAPKGSTLYVRTGVYDTYTGTGWELSNAARRTGERGVSRYKASTSARPEVPTSRISFKVLIDFYSSLPHTLNTVAFRFPTEDAPTAGYAGLGSGFILDTPLRRGTEIDDLVALPGQNPKPMVLRFAPDGRPSLLSETFDEATASRPIGYTDVRPTRVRGDGQVEQGGRGVSSATRELALASAKYGIQASRFLLTPWERSADLQTGNLPQQLIELAHRLGTSKTQDGIIRSIRTYLIDNYQYSLDTSPGGPYHDAVSNFLFDSKKGFCVQFASSFVILARLNGIPARYVTGFLAELPHESDQMIVTGLSAHSWAETWDNRRGWITEEATPPMIAAASGNPNVLSEFNPTDSGATQRQLEAVFGSRLSPFASNRTRSGGNLSSDFSQISQTLPGLPLLILIVGVGLIGFAARSMVRRLAPTENRFKEIVGKIVRRSQSRGFPDPSREGWREWSIEVARRSPGRAQVAHRAAAVIHRSFFSAIAGRGHPLSRDVVFLNRLYRVLLRRRKRGAKVLSPKPRVPSGN